MKSNVKRRNDLDLDLDHPAPLTASEWRALSQTEKLVRLSGRSLDRCWEILTEPVNARDPRDAVLLNAQIQTVRAVLHSCVKLGIEGARRVTAEDQRALEDLARRLSGRGEATSAK